MPSGEGQVAREKTGARSQESECKSAVASDEKTPRRRAGPDVYFLDISAQKGNDGGVGLKRGVWSEDLGVRSWEPGSRIQDLGFRSHEPGGRAWVGRTAERAM